jgi:hypothetical protein
LAFYGGSCYGGFSCSLSKLKLQSWFEAKPRKKLQNMMLIDCKRTGNKQGTFLEGGRVREKLKEGVLKSYNGSIE